MIESYTFSFLAYAYHLLLSPSPSISTHLSPIPLVPHLHSSLDFFILHRLRLPLMPLSSPLYHPLFSYFIQRIPDSGETQKLPHPSLI